MTDPSDPVYPGWLQHEGLPFMQTGGLTKREYCAALAMQGLLTGMRVSVVSSEQGSIELESVARSALLWADALIAELNKKAEA